MRSFFLTKIAQKTWQYIFLGYYKGSFFIIYLFLILIFFAYEKVYFIFGRSFC